MSAPEQPPARPVQVKLVLLGQSSFPLVLETSERSRRLLSSPHHLINPLPSLYEPAGAVEVHSKLTVDPIRR
jgi:hypothetical protein